VPNIFCWDCGAVALVASSDLVVCIDELTILWLW